MQAVIITILVAILVIAIFKLLGLLQEARQEASDARSELSRMSSEKRGAEVERERLKLRTQSHIARLRTTELELGQIRQFVDAFGLERHDPGLLDRFDALIEECARDSERIENGIIDELLGADFGDGGRIDGRDRVDDHDLNMDANGVMFANSSAPPVTEGDPR